MTEPRRRRVVVADNDADALFLINLDLRLEGHEIVGVAEHGDAAIDLCRRLQPDVLVVDYRMPPGPDGIDVTRVVSSDGNVRVILYTNYMDTSIRTQAAALGAVHLRKGQLAALRAAVAAP